MSRWFVGSSRSRTSGSVTSARASRTRRFLPAERESNVWSGSSDISRSVRSTLWRASQPRSSAPIFSMAESSRDCSSAESVSAFDFRSSVRNSAMSAPMLGIPSATCAKIDPPLVSGTCCVSDASRAPDSKTTEPSSGFSSPPISFRSVDLPAPFRPTSPTRSPRSIWTVTPSSRTGCENVKVTSLILSSAMRGSVAA